jgi:hypothetical protein
MKGSLKARSLMERGNYFGQVAVCIRVMSVMELRRAMA